MEKEPRPEDVIPDEPQNQAAREFLKHAPTKGLWMPLGKEVKVMQCWRCKSYGHRTGDKECPFFLSGNQQAEAFYRVYFTLPHIPIQPANTHTHTHADTSSFILHSPRFKCIHFCHSCSFDIS